VKETVSLPPPEAQEAKPARSEGKASVHAKAEPQALGAVVTDLRFEPKEGFVRFVVELSKDANVVKDRSSTREAPVLRLTDTRLPEALSRTLDTSAVAKAVVSAISSYNEGGDTILAANIGSGTEHRHWRKGNLLYWDFRNGSTASNASANPSAPAEPVAGAAQVLTYPEQATSGFETDAANLSQATLTGQKAHYTGRRISLDLKDADIHNVLRLLADVSKLNIVAADDVSGKITLKLRNVPWDQALDIILRAKQLDKTRNGNIIRVAPISVLEKEEQVRLARKEAAEKLEPLSVRLIPVSYAVADAVRPQVLALLSARGKVNIDARTNVLIVEDIAENLLKVERLVRTLDTQTPQVLIEARIIEATTSFTRDLGIQWGGDINMTQQFGTATGLAFPNNIRIAGAADDGTTPVAGVRPQNEFAVNLPAGVGNGSGGGLGFVFGSAGGSAILSLRLSAAETTGKGKTISAPKIVTIDNKEAHILSGEKVPITVVTANGPTTRFIDANLELAVTPHVTSDGSILLLLKATRNEISQRRDLLGTPGIITREAQTEMLVRDGDTAVLGGVYIRQALETFSYVPWFGQIPVLGWIFKRSNRQDSRDELLIFISPRIVNRSQALIQAK
jgi:type IV pilus assembly protein PilQ